MHKIREQLNNWLFKPPHDGVIWLAWFYVVFACIYAGGGPFAGDLVWFDDRVRLVQIFNWLNGADWYDRTIMRVNLPEGFHTIWSRFVDLPVAGIIALFQHSLGQMHAAMVAAILVPLLETLLLFFAAAYFTAPLTGQKHAKLVTLFVLFGSCINPEAFTLAGFQVGMIGHHSWYVLLTLLFFGAVARLIETSSPRHIATAGVAIGGLLVVGIEALPLIAGACGLVSLIAWYDNRKSLIFDMLRATAFGAALGFLSLPLNQPPSQLLTISFAEPSILGPIMILAASLYFLAQSTILRLFGERKALSLAFSIATAALIGTALIHFFPQMLDGAATALTPEERKLAADEHQEAMTIFRLARNNIDYIRMIVPPLLALGFAFYKLKTTPRGAAQSVIIFYSGLLLLTFAMASLFSRYFHYLGLATAPWLLMIMLKVAERVKRNEYYAIKCFVIYFLIGPLWLWLVPGANFNLAFGSAVLLYPAKMQTEPEHCDTRGFTDFVDLRYGDSGKTIIVPMYKSDRFLLHTRLNIFFLANFPSQNKFIDAKAFYETGSPDEAKRIVREHGIDLAAICKRAYLVSDQSTLTNQLLRGHMSFGQMLVTGKAPEWLKPIDVAVSTPWMLFEVDKDKLGDQR